MRAGDKLSERDAQVAVSLAVVRGRYWRKEANGLELFRELANATGAASAAPSSRFERLFQ